MFYGVRGGLIIAQRFSLIDTCCDCIQMLRLRDTKLIHVSF